jgi:hypothetical protein
MGLPVFLIETGSKGSAHQHGLSADITITELIWLIASVTAFRGCFPLIRQSPATL